MILQRCSNCYCLSFKKCLHRISERYYKPLTEKVSTILADLSSSSTTAEALMFDGKKLPNDAFLSDIKDLTDDNNVYLVQSSKPQFMHVDISEIEKYRGIFNNLMDDEELNLKEYICDPKNIKNFLLEMPSLSLSQIELDILSDSTLFIHYFSKYSTFMAEHASLFAIFKKAIDTVIATRSTRANFNPSSSVPQPFGFDNRSSFPIQQPTSSQAPPITSQMLQQALDLIGFVNPNSNNSSNPPQSAISAQQIQQQPPQLNNLNSAMEPDYTELRRVYALQLEQMHEFGFYDDEENIRALMVSDGSLDNALELIISMRE